MATGFDKTKRVLDAIVSHHMQKYRLDALYPVHHEKTIFDATFLGKLVRLARPSIEARLLSVRFAHRLAAVTGRATMRELRQLEVSLNDKSYERYRAVRNLFGGAVPTCPRPVFGEGRQEQMRDFLEVRGKDLYDAFVLSRRAR